MYPKLHGIYSYPSGPRVFKGISLIIGSPIDPSTRAESSQRRCALVHPFDSVPFYCYSLVDLSDILDKRIARASTSNNNLDLKFKINGTNSLLYNLDPQVRQVRRFHLGINGDLTGFYVHVYLQILGDNGCFRLIDEACLELGTCLCSSFCTAENVIFSINPKFLPKEHLPIYRLCAEIWKIIVENESQVVHSNFQQGLPIYDISAVYLKFPVAQKCFGVCNGDHEADAKLTDYKNKLDTMIQIVEYSSALDDFYLSLKEKEIMKNGIEATDQKNFINYQACNNNLEVYTDFEISKKELYSSDSDESFFANLN
jgi:hypothetical protein